MILAPEEAALYYRAWWPLLAWVNDKTRVVPAFPMPTPERPLSVAVAQPVRSALWADDRLLAQYLAERGAALAPDERTLVASWNQRKSGSFVVFKHLRAHSIFMSDEVFGVLGLYSPIAEITPPPPSYVTAVLLPFGDRIIIDGILSSAQLTFGPGIRGALARQYSQARTRSQIRTSLVATAKPKPATPVRRSVVGDWRITGTELWDRAALDLDGPATLSFGAKQMGSLSMIALQADLDYRVANEADGCRVDFSFEGDDDGLPCSGRGWATLGKDDVLRGKLFTHRGDESTFEAVRVPRRRRT